MAHWSVSVPEDAVANCYGHSGYGLRPSLTERVPGDLAAARMLMRAGVKLSSIVAYPFRRRRGDISLDFRNGASLKGPGDEPMLNLVREIWAQNRYPIPAVGEGDFIVDVGAHVGTFTVWAGLQCPTTKIIAVEPSPTAVEYLRLNVDRNRLPNVSVVEAACASDDGGRRLYRRGVLAMNTVFAVGTAGTGTLVHSVSLNAVFETFDIKRCALLKLDCEGAEYEILFSTSPETLKRIGAIAMEYHRGLTRYEEHALADYLCCHGFMVEVGAPEDEEGGYLYATAPDILSAGGARMR